MSFPSQFVDIQNAVIAKARLDAQLDLLRVKDWINQVYYQACIETNFYESSWTLGVPLTPNASSIAVPAAVVKLEYIVPTGTDGSNWATMDEVQFEEILDSRAWQGGSIPLGAPSKYAFRSGQASTIEFYPNAAGGEVFTFYGLFLPTALVADNAVPIFPEPFASKVLEYGALVQAAEFKKDIFFLNTYQQDWADWKMRLQMFNNQRPGAKVQQMRITNERPWPIGNSIDTGQ